MSFIDDIKLRAKKEIKTIVLPEAEDIRTLKAVDIIAKANATKETGKGVGGIIGLSSNGIIQNCKNYGNIKAYNYSNSTYSGLIAGGIVGLAGYTKETQEIKEEIIIQNYQIKKVQVIFLLKKEKVIKVMKAQRV